MVRTAGIGVQAPSAAALAAMGGTQAIRKAALYTLNTLLNLGVNTDFAPVLDLASPHANALPSRCWGATRRMSSPAPACGTARFARAVS